MVNNKAKKYMCIRPKHFLMIQAMDFVINIYWILFNRRLMPNGRCDSSKKFPQCGCRNGFITCNLLPISLQNLLRTTQTIYITFDRQTPVLYNDHSILVHRHHTDNGLTDTILQWFSSYLTDSTQYVSLCNHCSAFAPVHSGDQQDSVPGHMLFTMYAKPLSAIIDSHSIIHHSFADDLQLQLSAPSDKITDIIYSISQV